LADSAVSADLIVFLQVFHDNLVEGSRLSGDD
jgi:hypothetical protein